MSLSLKQHKPLAGRIIGSLHRRATAGRRDEPCEDKQSIKTIGALQLYESSPFIIVTLLSPHHHRLMRASSYAMATKNDKAREDIKST